MFNHQYSTDHLFAQSINNTYKNKKMKKIIAITAAFLLIAGAGFAQDWNWDKAHSQLNFGVTHMTINEFDGTFGTVEAKMTATKDDLTDAQILLAADVNSIN